MCIRDRAISGRSDEEAVSALEALTRRRIVREVAEDTGAIPVSYTHLRAHETVLDLVCRLLLEKKHYYNSLNRAETKTLGEDK